MRYNLARVVWSFAAEDFQDRVWANPHLPTPPGAFYFDLALSEIFDTGLLDEPSSRVIGSVLIDEAELAKLRALSATLDLVLDQIEKPPRGHVRPGRQRPWCSFGRRDLGPPRRRWTDEGSRCAVSGGRAALSVQCRALRPVPTNGTVGSADVTQSRNRGRRVHGQARGGFRASTWSQPS